MSKAQITAVSYHMADGKTEVWVGVTIRDHYSIELYVGDKKLNEMPPEEIRTRVEKALQALAQDDLRKVVVANIENG